MTIVALGGTGQVGRELARLPGVKVLTRAQIDLSDPGDLVSKLGAYEPKALINAAAYTAVDKAETERELAWRINADAPTELAIAARALNVPLVHISTDYVFSGDGETPFKPEDQTGPLGAYGASKRAGEIGVMAAGGTAAILRTSWVFSAHGSNFVKTMLRLGAERDALSIVEDQIGGPTSARAIAAACVTIAKRLSASADLSGIYHLSGAPDTSWADFARETFSQSGLAPEVTGIATTEYPTPATRPLNSRMDCTATKTAFGIDRPDWRADLSDILTELKGKER